MIHRPAVDDFVKCRVEQGACVTGVDCGLLTTAYEVSRRSCASPAFLEKFSAEGGDFPWLDRDHEHRPH